MYILMYEKLLNLKNALKKDCIRTKIFLVLYALALLLTTLFLSSHNDLRSWFCYPENSYQVLEEEAETLIKNKSFETNYDLKITSYDFKSSLILIHVTS